MSLLPLGTNGFFPSFGRQTACYLLPLGDLLLILDAGSGLFRLAEPRGKRLVKKAKRIHLYLSHYHLDHTFGFYAAFRLLEDKHVTVFGKDKKKVFSELTKLDYFPIDYQEKYSSFRWKKLNEGKYDMKAYQVSVRRQLHRGHGSLAFRFSLKSPKGGDLVYTTDSEPTDASVEFAKNADLLLHEHGYSGEKLLKEGTARQKHIIDGHVTSAGAAMIAKEAGVKKLALIHHSPFSPLSRLEKKHLRLAQTIFPKTMLACDLKPIAW